MQLFKMRASGVVSLLGSKVLGEQDLIAELQC